MASTRCFRVLRRTDARLPPSFIVEQASLSHSLVCEAGAMLEIPNDLYESAKAGYERVLDGYGLLGIVRFDQDEQFLVIVTGMLSVAQIGGNDIYKITAVQCVDLRGAPVVQQPNGRPTTPSQSLSRINDLTALLSSGHFYFSPTSPGTADGATQPFDLTLSAQARASGRSSDSRFFWNRALWLPFERWGVRPEVWLLRIISGSIVSKMVYVGAHQARVAIISRLSCERVGARFHVRGLDHDGHVANFVETEQVVWYKDQLVSHVQIRGSVPLFWDQPGFQVGQHRVRLRAFETSAPAFHRHMTQLRSAYESLFLLNLCGHGEGERLLSDAYKTRHESSTFASSTPFLHFDYHANVRGGASSSSQSSRSAAALDDLKSRLQPFLEQTGFFHCDGDKVLKRQSGALRTNCVDCLDRTNSVQTLVGLLVLQWQIGSLRLDAGSTSIESRFEGALKSLWQLNGDACSCIYAGTGALEGRSKLKDASRSLARTLQNNLWDGNRQDAFELLLNGAVLSRTVYDTVANLLPPRFLPQCLDAVHSIAERAESATEPRTLKILAGTWNVNGGKNMANVALRGSNQADLIYWLFPEWAASQQALVSVEERQKDEDIPDIVAVGLEEIVDLNASNVVKASTTNQRAWCAALRDALKKRGGGEYVLVGSEQLVGVCLFLFIRRSLGPALRDFAVSSVKTGMGGAAGNKGSVAFRLLVHSTSICFVCSHFAAGQNEVRERNADYNSAMSRLRFPGGRDIDSHDVVVWMGDFNYRIGGLSSEEVRRALRDGQLDMLRKHDQLTQERADEKVFHDFNEGDLSFWPTYKYDTFSDDYDTSEKARSPAWTDRVLFRCSSRSSARLVSYSRGELRTSDHRPVLARLLVDARRVVASRLVELLDDVFHSLGPPDATVVCSLDGGHSRFPFDLYPAVCAKLKELSIQLVLSKYEGNELWLVLADGEQAIAALSMSDIRLGNYVLRVRLRSPDWCDFVAKSLPSESDWLDAGDQDNNADAISTSDAFADFGGEGDDDEGGESVTSTTLSQQRQAPPPVPRAPPPRPVRPAPPVPAAPKLADLDPW